MSMDMCYREHKYLCINRPIYFTLEMSSPHQYTDYDSELDKTVNR